MRRALVLICAAAAFPAAAQAPRPAPPPPENIRPAAAALAAAPKTTIRGGGITAVILTPDPQRGFYRGTRFDWSGVISSLTYRGQEYYGLWFDGVADNVRDYVRHDGGIVAGPNTATLGPAEAYDVTDPPGWAEAAPGGLFLKIGVGVLRKPEDGQPYSSFRRYDIVDGGAWAVKPGRDRVDFTHTVSAPSIGYGYVYRKRVLLEGRRPVMRLEHSLQNTGARPITTTTFNHNFLTLGGKPTGPGLTVATPFAIRSARPPNPEAAEIVASKVVYRRALNEPETVSIPIEGFGPTAADHRIQVTDARGAGFSVVGDQPLNSLQLWSIHRTVSAEPFVRLEAAPGERVAWSWTYTYSTAQPPQGRQR